MSCPGTGSQTELAGGGSEGRGGWGDVATLLHLRCAPVHTVLVLDARHHLSTDDLVLARALLEVRADALCTRDRALRREQDLVDATHRDSTGPDPEVTSRWTGDPGVCRKGGLKH